MAVTRDDVARAAGTSTAVVSYVLNDGPRNVSPQTRERVLRAIAELGYRPNRMASALRSRRSRVLGMIVPDNSNPFFAELTNAVEDTAFELGYVLLVGNACEQADREAQYIRTFLGYQVDALLVIGVVNRAPHDLLSRASVPVVVLDRLEPHEGLFAVAIDNQGGAAHATRHLIEHGYRSVGCIAGPTDAPVSVARRAGWQAAVDEAGLASAGHAVVCGPFTREGGYEAALRLLRHRRRPRALFVSSDQQAVGVLRAADELGLSVPGDLALFSFDGTQEAAFTTPPLSTIRQPFTLIARTAISHALAATASTPQTTVLPYEVELRRSCGCHPTHPTHNDSKEKQGVLQ
jgi:LacI family transcriptional regulator, galactose operon repressor